MGHFNKRWFHCVLVLALAIMASPAPSRSDPYRYPHQKPLVFANRLDIDPTPESAVSFDCRHAGTSVEQLICADLSLARADGDLDFSYRLLMHWAGPSERAAILTQQRDWLRHRAECRDADCLRKVYDGRGSELRKQLRSLQLERTRHVATPGACELTHIEMIGGRLQDVEGQKPSGMTFVYANGVTQVSYDRDRKALRSIVGDPVRVCLLSIPRNCPPGDDRGRIYTSYNLRTRVRWTLPDAEHGCGGA